MKVMVIEDGTIIRQVLCDYLSILGIDEVLEFQNGLEGIEFLKNNPTERLGCIFLDLNMDQMDGITFLREFDAHVIFRDTPIFVVSGHPNSQNIISCFHHEVSCFIKKPFNIQQIAECVEVAKEIEKADPLLAKTCY